jgi:hypothetical protein
MSAALPLHGPTHDDDDHDDNGRYRSSHRTFGAIAQAVRRKQYAEVDLYAIVT